MKGAFQRHFGPLVQKAFKSTFHIELPLRPIQATQITTGPFWTRQKRFEVFWISNRNLVEGIVSTIKGFPKTNIQYTLSNMTRRTDYWTPDKHIEPIIIYSVFLLELTK